MPMRNGLNARYVETLEVRNKKKTGSSTATITHNKEMLPYNTVFVVKKNENQ